MPSARRSVTLSELEAVCRAQFAATTEDLLGLECEWPVRPADDPLARPDLGQLMNVADQPLPEAGRVTIEPGGQIELSSAPQASVGDAIRSVEVDEDCLHGRLRAIGLHPEDSALDAVRDPLRILDRPRYRAMQAHFDAQGPAGRWMMCNTASVQVNISNDQGPGGGRWRVLNHVSPVLLAMFANSRAVDADGVTWASARQGIWWNIDPTRTRPVPMTDDPAQGWLSYALAARMFYIPTQGPGSQCGVGVSESMTFAQWMDRGHVLGWPTLDDFRYHLTTLFPPVRPRGWMELRVLDALTREHRTAAALAVAVLCADHVRQEVLDRVPDTSDLWLVAARDGLTSPRIARAARILTDVVSTYAEDVADCPEHVAALDAFIDRYTSRGLTPGDDTWVPIPIGLAEGSRSRGPLIAPIAPIAMPGVLAGADELIWST